MEIDVADNSIVGPGAIPGETIGFDYQDGVGQTSGNMVSNFFAMTAGVACSFRLAKAEEDVTLGTNTFPDPPGNEQDVCDVRS